MLVSPSTWITSVLRRIVAQQLTMAMRIEMSTPTILSTFVGPITLTSQIMVSTNVTIDGNGRTIVIDGGARVGCSR
jgi:hypothetical protein